MEFVADRPAKDGLETRLRQSDSLPRGRDLATLEDAAGHIMNLPKAEQDLEEWQTATGCLIGAAEGRDFVMHSRIGVMRSFTDRKDLRWGRRKLRDQK
jgi:hypothetical protein